MEAKRKQEMHTVQKSRLIRPEEVVAFLQNPWFRPGTSERTIRQYQGDVEFRRRVLEMSMTGKRLLQAFDNIWYRAIWWDNANPRPTFDPAGVNLPDHNHIRSVILIRKPSVILTFGLHAREGVQRVLEDMHGRVAALEWMAMHVMHCHHPNARFKGSVDLANFALALKRKEVACE